MFPIEVNHNKSKALHIASNALNHHRKTQGSAFAPVYFFFFFARAGAAIAMRDMKMLIAAYATISSAGASQMCVSASS